MLIHYTFNTVGWDCVSQYSNLLWVRWSGDQIPVGAKFSASIQTLGLTQPVYNGYRGIPGSKAASAWL